MATKTWKIGERCRGGIITIEIKGEQIHLIGKDWNHENGGRRSQQVNNKEWCRKTLHVNSKNVRNEICFYLNDLTTYYYTDIMLKWIESKVELEKDGRW